MTQQAPPPDVQRVVTANGEEVLMTPDEAAAGVRQGLVSFVGQVPLRDDAGELHMVDADTANQRIAGTYTGAVGGAGAYEKQEEAKQFDTLGSKAAAFGIGAGNALTLGFGRGLAVDLAQADDKEAVRRYLAAQEEHNAGYSTAGEVAGLIAPALFTGGTSAAASGAARGVGTVGRIATAAPRGLGFLAETAGEFAPRALGLAETGIAGRALGAGVRGAVEMVPYSVGDAYSRARVEDKELTSEQLLAAAGHGALMGGAFGGGLSLLGSGAAAAMRGAGTLAEKAAPRAEALAEKLGVKAPPLSLDALVTDQAIKATGAQLGQVQKLRAMAPEIEQRVTRIITDKLPELAGKDLARISREEGAALAETYRKSAGKEIDAAIKGLDSAVAKGAERPSLDAVVAQAREQLTPVIASAEELGGKAGTLKKALAGLETIAEKGEPMSFERMHELRQKIDSKVKWDPAEISLSKEQKTINDGLKDLRSMFEAEMQRAGDAAAAKEGAEFATRWAEAKSEYQAAKWAAGAFERGAAGEQRNATMGLREMLGSGAASNVGTTIGSAFGPVGAAVGGVLGGAVGALASNVGRRYGNQAIASLASKAIETDIVRAITSKVEATTAGQVTQFLAKKVPNVAPSMALAERTYEGKKRSAQREYEERHKALVAFRANPQAVLAKTTGRAPDDVRAALQSKTIAVAEYLASKAPPALGGNPLVPMADPGRVDPAARDKWLRAARAADDPQSIVSDMRSGRLTPEAVDAVKTLYPRMYGQITGQIMGALAERTEPLSYSQASQLRVLLGVPVDVSQKPGYLAAVQGMAPTVLPAPQAPSRATMQEPSSVAKTGSQKLEENRE